MLIVFIYVMMMCLFTLVMYLLITRKPRKGGK